MKFILRIFRIIIKEELCYNNDKLEINNGKIIF